MRLHSHSILCRPNSVVGLQCTLCLYCRPTTECNCMAAPDGRICSLRVLLPFQLQRPRHVSAQFLNNLCVHMLPTEKLRMKNVRIFLSGGT